MQVRTQQYSYTEWVHIEVVDEGSMDYRCSTAPGLTTGGVLRSTPLQA